jgi:hypothetical protein
VPDDVAQDFPFRAGELRHDEIEQGVVNSGVVPVYVERLELAR